MKIAYGSPSMPAVPRGDQPGWKSALLPQLWLESRRRCQGAATELKDDAGGNTGARRIWGICRAGMEIS